MRSTQALSITLPIKMAQMVREKVATGEYASESEVVSEGLRVLAEQDASIERWLREEVAPAYDELKAHPERTVSLDEAFDHFDEHIKSIAACK